MGGFAQWLLAALKSFVVWIWNGGVDIVQKCMNGLVDFLILIVSLFPTGSTTPSLSAHPAGNTWDTFITTLNWVFPVSFIVTFIGFIVAALLAYFIIAPLARWAKLLT